MALSVRKFSDQFIDDPCRFLLGHELLPRWHRGARPAIIDRCRQATARLAAQVFRQQRRTQSALQRHAMAGATILSNHVHQRTLPGQIGFPGDCHGRHEKKGKNEIIR